MQNIDICGKRGLGDLISGISRVLIELSRRPETNHHLQFHYPDGYDYSTTITTLMSEFVSDRVSSYDILEKWGTININEADRKFGKDNYKATWFFTYCKGHHYTPFRTRWKGNRNGPIGLMLNNENTRSGYPYPEKWFSNEMNDRLLSLVDDKDFYALGRPLSVRENINIISECRFIIGVDGAWAHAANAMRVPCYIVRNGLSNDIVSATHHGHRSLTVVETNEVFKYVGL